MKAGLRYVRDGYEISFPLDRDRIKIGRTGVNDLVLDFDNEVSSAHAVIIREERGFFIEDLGSRNKTFVDGSPLYSRIKLENNMKIRLGKTEFLYFQEEVLSPSALPSSLLQGELLYTRNGLNVFFPLDKDRIKIGRTGGNDFVLDFDDEVSSAHAVITREETGFFIEDLGSRNKTFLDGSPLYSRIKLENNMKIRVGRTEFLIILASSVPAGGTSDTIVSALPPSSTVPPLQQYTVPSSPLPSSTVPSLQQTALPFSTVSSLSQSPVPPSPLPSSGVPSLQQRPPGGKKKIFLAAGIVVLFTGIIFACFLALILPKFFPKIPFKIPFDIPVLKPTSAPESSSEDSPGSGDEDDITDIIIVPNPELIITTEQEIELGEETVKEIEKEYGLYDNSEWKSLICETGKKLSKISPRDGITYKFNILDMDVPNAFALPGGWVYVTRNMMEDFVCNDKDKLAFVLAHELGHINKRHSMMQLELSLGAEALIDIISDENTSGRDISQVVSQVMFLAYSREQEIEADTYGMTVSYKAGYRPEAATEFFRQLKVYEDSNPSYLPEFLSSHPGTATRIVWSEGYVVFLKEGKM